MKPLVAALLPLLPLATACIASDTDEDLGLDPDSGEVTDDAEIDTPLSEPKPAFTVGTSLGGQIAVDEVGIRETFVVQGTEYMSTVSVGLTETATNKTCGVKLGPKFGGFGHSSTSTRQFKTVVLDLAGSVVLEDNCGWDDGHIIAGIADRLGNYYVGFAQARFAEDRPYLDIYMNASKGLGNSTASVVRVGAGEGYQMNPDGTVVDVMVQPTPGTLVPALYIF